MNSRVGTLVRKEILDLSRNPGALLPVVLMALVGLALPFAITILVPALTGQRLSDESDLYASARSSAQKTALGLTRGCSCSSFSSS